MAKINNKRWMKTEIFLENGKAFAENKTEIDIYFKNKGNIENENIITFRIQPDEGIRIKFFVKKPGYDTEIVPKTLKFKYADTIDLSQSPNDYERLIHDAFFFLDPKKKYKGWGHSSWTDGLSLARKYSIKKIALFKSPAMLPVAKVLHSYVDTNLDFESFYTLLREFAEAGLDEHPEWIELSMVPNYKTTDYHFDFNNPSSMLTRFPTIPERPPSSTTSTIAT
jgi:hypothetical protein